LPAAGVVRSFQICAVFPHLTVLENVRVALQRSLGTSFYFWRSEKSLSQLDSRAMQLLAEVRLEEWARTLTADLPYGRKRALELATTLALEPELNAADEPTQVWDTRTCAGHAADQSKSRPTVPCSWSNTT